MVVHLVRIAAITISIIVCTFLPFLPGRYDGFAVTLSAIAQLFGIAGLLLVPIGVLWLIYELRKRALIHGTLSRKDKGYYFAIASVGALSILASVVSIFAFASSFSLGFITLALWIYGVSRIVPRLKLLKNAEVGVFTPTPLYLIFVPIVVALFQFALVGPATEFSRNYAIKKSAELINDIEEYHRANGRYPKSLLSLWEDYDPSVIGIERFHYELHGDAYNLFFEQFRLHPLGTREIVMYSKLDEHFIAAHNMDRLTWIGEELEARQGYYAVYDASRPHWKYFWFD